jgi:hypothetical protein
MRMNAQMHNAECFAGCLEHFSFCILHFQVTR